MGFCDGASGDQGSTDIFRFGLEYALLLPFINLRSEAQGGLRAGEPEVDAGKSGSVVVRSQRMPNARRYELRSHCEGGMAQYGARLRARGISKIFAIKTIPPARWTIAHGTMFPRVDPRVADSYPTCPTIELGEDEGSSSGDGMFDGESLVIMTRAAQPESPLPSPQSGRQPARSHAADDCAPIVTPIASAPRFFGSERFVTYSGSAKLVDFALPRHRESAGVTQSERSRASSLTGRPSSLRRRRRPPYRPLRHGGHPLLAPTGRHPFKVATAETLRTLLQAAAPLPIAIIPCTARARKQSRAHVARQGSHVAFRRPCTVVAAERAMPHRSTVASSPGADT